MYAPRENISNWVQDEPEVGQRPPRYTSKYGRGVAPTASTFGLQGSTKVPGANRGLGTQETLTVKKERSLGPAAPHMSNAGDFLRKGGKDVVSTEMPPQFVRPLVRPKRPPVPSRGEKPVMGLQTTKNFLVANAVENILAVPKKIDDEQPRYVSKRDFGRVPDYLNDVKAAIEEEKAVLREYLEEEVQYDEGPTAVEMPAKERRMLILKLKKKWDSVNHEYQKISHQTILDTINKLKKKEFFEASLESLEKTIEKLEGYGKIYVTD
jgi:hypothetical protein